MTTQQTPGVRVLRPLRDFLRTETASGVLLVAAAAAALVWANSPWRDTYHDLWSTVGGWSAGGFSLTLDLRHWVNDAAMTLFFLVVGLEIRRETATGHLADRRAAALPVAAALGGMAVPAGLYLLIAGRDAAHGWGVPMATDIALAVGVVVLAGPQVPRGVRTFLLGLAVADDIGAIIVIAVFYASGVEAEWLAVGAGALVVTLAARRAGINVIALYVTLGVVLWYSLHEAGVHPTLAGVAMGLLAPTTPRVAPDLVDAEQLEADLDLSLASRTAALSADDHSFEAARSARATVSTVEWLEHLLHPWAGYVVVPVFALANAGIEVSATSLRHAAGSTVAWGVLVGLLVGKPVGVLVAARAALRTGRVDLPDGASGRHLAGAGAAAGIGFTVALFIAELAFTDERQVTDAKMAILLASVLSGVVSLAVLRGRRADRA
ncbi:MAG: Na+/H+ antiporter NhaA [Ilumatobacteraceae bacterium]